jgi:tRNA A37 methylthiotransferase MiaB
MAGQVPKRIRQERSKQIRQLGEELARQQQKGLIGQQLRVLVQDKAGVDGLHSGLCEQYFQVAFEGPKNLTGQMVSVLLEEVDQNGARGSWQEVRPVSGRMEI